MRGGSSQGVPHDFPLEKSYGNDILGLIFCRPFYIITSVIVIYAAVKPSALAVGFYGGIDKQLAPFVDYTKPLPQNTMCRL